jgi:predicted DNA-binding transcriptional regulator AlpA
MPDSNALPQPDTMAELIDRYGVVDAKGLAEMIGLSHRTVMVYAAEHAWRTGHLPQPLYVGRSVRTHDGKGRRWRRATVRAWIAAVEAERRGEVA